MALSKKLIKRYLKTDPAQIGHYINSGYMNSKIGPVFQNCKVIGPAYTIRVAANDSAIVYYAMKKAPKGSVIVIDRLGDEVYACAGEIVARSAKALGMAGIVIDGPSTDVQAMREIKLPVFSTGLSPVTTTLLGLTGEYNIPIQCGGTIVNPGDIIFGDDNGVIVIPPQSVEELLLKAEEADKKEEKLREIFRQGKYVDYCPNLNALVKTDHSVYFKELK